jgi:hypothetical protein
MFWTRITLCLGVLTAVPIPVELRAATTIVVNWGKNASAVAAGHTEEQLDWHDPEAADPTACTHAFAALELQHYLREMTGRGDDFAIASDRAALPADLILVGGPAANAQTRQMAPRLGVDAQQLARMAPEAYRIKSTAVDGRQVLLIAGGGRVGTLYGVYDLLYRLGCRWFAPGPLGEEVPKIDRLGAWDVTERPAFRSRGFLAWEDRGDPEFLLWMARNRLNYWCVEQRQHALMHKLGIRMVAGLHDAEELFLNPAGEYPYAHPRFAASGNKPADPYPVSPLYEGDADRDGKLSYFEAHPEWYALVKGRRVPGIRGMAGTNYCTSNADATAEFMKNYVQSLIEGPYRDAQMVRFWTLDGGAWCECEACRALGIPTDRNLLLVHRLYQEIEKARARGAIRRPIEITFLAYADVLQPPTRPLPAGFNEAMCAATFYPIQRCYVHNFDDPACAPNRRYLRELYGWAADPARHYRGQIAIGEYYNVSVYKCLPLCLMHTMAHDIPVYYRLGARQFDYMHVTTRDWGPRALVNYQMARQLWDVGTDCPVLWDDYFARRYGPAAAPMGRFYASLERMFANVTELKYGLARRLDRGAKDLFPAAGLRYRRQPGVACDGPTLVEMIEHGRQCRRCVEEALGRSLPQRIRERIAEDERSLTYGQRTLDYYDQCVQAFQLDRAGKIDAARRHYAEAVRLAGLLREDRASTATSSSHANAPDAFAATLATGALKTRGPSITVSPGCHSNVGSVGE